MGFRRSCVGKKVDEGVLANEWQCAFGAVQEAGDTKFVRGELRKAITCGDRIFERRTIECDEGDDIDDPDSRMDTRDVPGCRTSQMRSS